MKELNFAYIIYHSNGIEKGILNIDDLELRPKIFAGLYEVDIIFNIFESLAEADAWLKSKGV